MFRRVMGVLSVTELTIGIRSGEMFKKLLGVMAVVLMVTGMAANALAVDPYILAGDANGDFYRIDTSTGACVVLASGTEPTIGRGKRPRPPST